MHAVDTEKQVDKHHFVPDYTGEAAEMHHADAEEAEEYLPGLNPKPSYWPVLLCVVLPLLPVGALFMIWGSPFYQTIGFWMLVVGGALSLIPTMGWAHSVIVDKWEGHFGAEAQHKDLALGTKLFFLSEIAIFGSLFAYYFVQRAHAIKLTHATGETFWPPAGTPLISPTLPAIGLVILLVSSITAEIAHKALIRGKRGLSKDWLLVTMALGLMFLFIQGYEYGILAAGLNFDATTNWFGTLFYSLTGFHGIHVMTGLIMLMIVYGRLEFGHYNPKRHFSMQAASWYWHLVDVVWVFVFVFVYCLQDFGH